jgi:hypothetical protein
MLWAMSETAVLRNVLICFTRLSYFFVYTFPTALCLLNLLLAIHYPVFWAHILNLSSIVSADLLINVSGI